MKSDFGILLFILFIINIVSCSKDMEFYVIEPLNSDYFSTITINDMINSTGNNILVFFDIIKGEILISIRVNNLNQYQNIYIKEIYCNIYDTKIYFIKDKHLNESNIFKPLKIDEIEKKKLLENIGKNRIELPVIQKYSLDNGELIHEELIYFFEYYQRRVSFFER